jgi:hypothetical protein
MPSAEEQTLRLDEHRAQRSDRLTDKRLGLFATRTTVASKTERVPYGIARRRCRCNGAAGRGKKLSSAMPTERLIAF